MKIHIACFSGTGGTARAAACLKKELTALGNQTEKQRISLGTTEFCRLHLLQADMLIILFPVHAFDAPRLVYTWLQDYLEKGTVPKAAVVSVSGGGEIGPNRGSRSGLIGLLEAKGSKVVYEDMLIMPCNFLTGYHDELSMHLLHAMQIKCSQIAVQLHSGIEQRCGRQTRPWVFSAISRMEQWWAHRFARSIRVTESCTGCGMCSRLCPASNITMENNRPRFLDQCSACFGCVYLCPEQALYSTNPTVLKQGYSLKKVEQGMKGFRPGTWKPYCRGPHMKAVRVYLEDIYPSAENKA